MKKTALLLAAMALVVGLLVGCSVPTPDQLQTVSDNTAALAKQAAEIKAQLDVAKTTLQATTQPSSAPTAVAVEKKLESGVDVAVKGINQAVPILTTASAAVAAAVNGQNPGPVIVASAPLFGPAAVYVGMAGTVVGVLATLWQTFGKKKVADAYSTAVDGIQKAIADGQLVVANAQAYATVDSSANDHPTSSRLVDVIAAAPVVAAEPQ